MLDLSEVVNGFHWLVGEFHHSAVYHFQLSFFVDDFVVQIIKVFLDTDVLQRTQE